MCCAVVIKLFLDPRAVDVVFLTYGRMGGKDEYYINTAVEKVLA